VRSSPTLIGYADTPGLLNAGHDNGNAFMGEEFQELLISYGIESKPTTVKIIQPSYWLSDSTEPINSEPQSIS
jgi:hypothetical protein